MCGHMIAAFPCLVSKPILLTDLTIVRNYFSAFPPKTLLLVFLNVLYRQNLSPMALEEIERVIKLRSSETAAPLPPRKVDKKSSSPGTNGTKPAFVVPVLDEGFIRMYSLGEAFELGKDLPNMGKISCGVMANTLYGGVGDAKVCVVFHQNGGGIEEVRCSCDFDGILW